MGKRIVRTIRIARTAYDCRLRRLDRRRRDPEYPVVGTSFAACSAFMDPLVSADMSAQCKTFSIALPGCVETPPTWSSAVTSMSPLGIGDQHDGIRFTRGERELLDRLADEFDLASCWQAANPNRPLAQTLRWMGNPKRAVSL